MARTVEQILRAQKIFNDIAGAIPKVDRDKIDISKFQATNVTAELSKVEVKK